MSIITRMRKQKAVYWPPSSDDFDDYGQPVHSTPVEVTCRWEDSHEMFLDSEGNQEVSNAIVYVNTDVELRGLLRLGDLTSLPDTSPYNNTGVFTIRRFEKIPNLRATEFLRIAML